MRGSVLPLLGILVLPGCGGSAPSQPEAPVEPNFRAVATVHVAAGPDSGSTPFLMTRVVLSSLTSAPTRLTINHQCPVFLRLYRTDSADTLPVYDEGDDECSRIAELIEIPPTGSRELVHELSLKAVHDAGVGPGTYAVHVVVASTEAGGGPGKFSIDAGQIDIP